MKAVKIFLRSLVLPIIFCTVSALPAADNMLPRQNNVRSNFIKIPFRDKGKLELMIFAATGITRGNVIHGENIFIDQLLPGTVDNIPDGWSEQLYPINSKLPEIVDFWQRRCNISNMVVFTPRCDILQNSRMLHGSDKVFLRTDQLDLDGVGFRIDFNTQIVEVNSQVQIVVRTADSDPREIAKGLLDMPKVYRTIHATSNSIRMDMLNNEIMLIGNVKVIDGVNIIECDRLTVLLSENAKPGHSGKKRTAPAAGTANKKIHDSSSMLKDVSRIHADGNVVITRRPETAKDKSALQKGYCTHLEYDVESGRIIMTGDAGKDPLLTQNESRLSGKRIEIMRFSDKAFVLKDCIIETPVKAQDGGKPTIRRVSSDRAFFDGANNMSTFFDNVRVNDSQMTLSCSRMRVFMKPEPAKPSRPGTKKSAAMPDAAEFSPVSGNREIDRIVCNGDVKIAGIPQDPNAQPRTIISRRAYLDYNGNKLIFLDDVLVHDNNDSLKCKRLDLFLADRKTPATALSGAPVAGGTHGQNKILQKILAWGNVVMKNSDSELRTELLTMHFRELAPGEKPAQGMFQSGGALLIRINCDGKVEARDLLPADPARRRDREKDVIPGSSGVLRILNANHAISDLVKDFSEFHGDVVIVDRANRITCRDMYVFTGKNPNGSAPLKSKTEPAKDANAAPAESSTANADSDPDADPFVMDMNENSVPSRIALSEDVDLKRIIWKNDVILCNTDSKGKKLYAGGDTAVYTVKTREIIITAEPPNRPYMRNNGRKQFCDEIRGNLETEEFEGIGKVIVIPDEEE